MPTTYTCKNCGAVVFVKKEVTRSCNCPPDTGITAHLQAVAYGVGLCNDPAKETACPQSQK